LYVDSGATSGFSSNDNVLWNATSQAPVRFASTVYALLSTFAAATANDARSNQADPRFLNPQAGDFHLMSGSPAIDAADATVADCAATDVGGRAPADDPATPNRGLGAVDFADRGALEYVSGNAPPIAALAVTPVTGRAPLLVSADASGSSDPDDGIAG